MNDIFAELAAEDAKDATRRAAHLVLILMDNDRELLSRELGKLAYGDDADPEFVAQVAGMAAVIAAVLAKQHPGEFIRNGLNQLIAENSTFRIEDLGNAP